MNEELGLEFEEDSLSYDTVVDLLGRVSQAKTDNIVSPLYFYESLQ